MAAQVLHCLIQRYSTAGTRPGTGTWRPFYRDLKHILISKSNSINLDITKIVEFSQ